MRRYWFSIILFPLIVLCVGTYYIQAESRYPEFVLEKQEGDEKEAAAVQLQGQFRQGSMRDAVNIGLHGSEYAGEKSFLARIAPYWGREEVKKLAEEYRNFMRGKREHFSFYEDERLLVYANVKEKYSGSGQYSFRFTVSLLDKKTYRSSSYEVNVPNGNLYNRVIVNDVQVVGEQLKVVTQNYNNNGNTEIVEIHLYTLGLTDAKEPVDQVLFQSRGNTDMNTNIGMGNEENVIHPNKYIVIHSVQIEKVQNDRGGYTMKETGGQLHVFDIQSGQEVKLESQEISEFLSGGARENRLGISLQGDNLFLAKKTGKGTRVVRYNIPEARLTAHDVQTDSVDNLTLMNGRLYMLTKKYADKEELPSLVVADADTGKLLFKGDISLKGTESNRADELGNLYIYDLLVKQERPNELHWN